MKKPIVIINLKTYKQGKDLLKLAKVIERVDKKIIVGAPASEISDLVDNTDLVIYSQHVDFMEPGRNTGFIMLEAVKKQGAKGTFLNHSEHRLDFRTIKKTVKRCNDIGLKTAIFAKDLREAKKIQKLKPDYLIVEPPELVAGKVSVSKAKPEFIEKIAKKLKAPFLVGAGIKTKEDIDIAMKLGASGVAFASVVIKAKEPGKVLRKLLG